MLAVVVSTLVGPVAETEDEILLAPESAEESMALGPETRQAALGGDAQAQYRLGKNLLFEASLDGRKAIEATEWLSKAARSGHTGAMIQLGRMYKSGVGALQNFTYSAQWISKAAEAGDAEGMLELGRLYRDGVGVEEDFEKAYVWFNRAAAMLHADAVREREAVGRRLKPEQLERAQLLSEGSEDEPYPPSLERPPKEVSAK